MSTCMSCGARREGNILRHSATCPVAQRFATASAAASTPVGDLREHPDLARLEVDLDAWYPTD